MTDDDQDLNDDVLDELEIDEQDEEEMAETGLRGPEFAAGLMLGAVLGAVVALLAAPQAGARTRRDIGRKARRIRHDVEDRWDGAHRDVRRRKRKIRGQVDKVAKRTRKAIKQLT